MVDGDNNGIPDDAVSYGVSVSCSRIPLPTLVVKAAFVRDLNGDGAACRAGGGQNCDQFCDTGEQCEINLLVQNLGPMDLTDVTLFISESDDDIECVTQASVPVGAWPAGATIDTRNIGGQNRPFGFTASQTAITTTPGTPPRET